MDSRVFVLFVTRFSLFVNIENKKVIFVYNVIKITFVLKCVIYHLKDRSFNIYVYQILTSA